MSWSLTLWRRYSSYSFFWRGKLQSYNKTPPSSAFLLRATCQGQSHRTSTLPFWSSPPPEHTPASPAVAFSVCPSELVESCKNVTILHVLKSHAIFDASSGDFCRKLSHVSRFWWLQSRCGCQSCVLAIWHQDSKLQDSIIMLISCYINCLRLSRTTLPAFITALELVWAYLGGRWWCRYFLPEGETCYDEQDEGEKD